MGISYQTLSDGTVQTLQGGEWTTPWPPQAEIDLFNKQTAQWLPLVQDAVAKYGLPPVFVFYILAIIYSESAGKANIGPSFDGGVGLMAITHWSLKVRPDGGKYTDEELKDPVLNIDIGVGKMIAPEYNVMGIDLPQIASGFNGGYSKTKGANRSNEAPWGWREYKIPSTGAFPYISKVVRIANYAIQALSDKTGGTETTLAPESVPDEEDKPGLFTYAMALGLGSGVAYTLFRVWKAYRT